MNKKKILGAIMTVFVMVPLFAGCAGNKTSGTGASKSAQEINVAFGDDMESMDQSKMADTVPGTILNQVNECLTRIENNKLVPAGAEKWETSQDGLKWTFHLRDFKYNDGKQVKAEDYVYAFERLFDPKVASPNAALFYVIKGSEEFNSSKGKFEDVGVKAIDEKTLEVTLKESTPYFLQLLTMSCAGPLRKDVVEAQGDTYGTDNTKLVYSGPFVVDEWAKGSKIILKKNQEYWGAKDVKLEKVNVHIVPEAATQEQMFDSKQLDIIDGAKTEYADKLKDKVSKGEVIKADGYEPGNGYVAFNSKDKNKIFTNAKVRKAFSLAIDREQLINNVTKRGTPAYGFVPYAINLGDIEYRKDAKEPLKDVKDDPKQLFQEGLKELGLDPNKEITVNYLQSNSKQTTKSTAEFFQNQWETKLGVKVKLDIAGDGATFNKMIRSGDFQIVQSGWGADYNDPMNFIELLVTGNGNNIPLYSNAKYDELVKASQKTNDMKERLELFKKAENIIVNEDAVVAPLSYAIKQAYVQKYVKNMRLEVFSTKYDFRNVSIEK